MTLRLLNIHIIAIIASLFTLASCSDDESFTSDSNAILTFSHDTIAFDTLFTTIASSTERFNVYNSNNSGLRIAKVELESGGSSGFKMNVDGQYGTTLESVEIQKKDSIFIFVEVKVPEVEGNLPVKVTDRIIFTLQSGVKQSVALEAWGQNCKQIKSPVITTNTTFSNELPIIIYDSLVIKEGATLTIPAGTTICMHNYADINVHGNLNIEGTIANPVVIRGDRMDRLFPYLPYDRLDKQWSGIKVYDTSTGINIDNADIHSGSYGIYAADVKGKIQITNTSIHNFAWTGLSLENCDALIANCQITNCGSDCVSIFGGKQDFYHCTIGQFYPWAADRGNAVTASNSIGGTIDCIIEKANFYNCLITGYANDEVMGDFGNQDYLNIHFFNSLVNTDISDPTYFTECTGDSKDAEIRHDKHFKTIDIDTYYYDFRLDSLSRAIGVGSSAYSALYPIDKNGNKRSDKPSVGCYEFVGNK